MSGNDEKAPENPTPQEQVAGQVALTNGMQGVMTVMHDAFGFGSDRAFVVSDKLSEKLKVKSGPTSFEETLLNAMLDLVDNTKPSDLENAGSALWKASQAISDAATELRANIKHATGDFQGEAGDAFQKWGEKLAGHTEKLSTYVESAGVEIAAAASGLASVKSSLPPRDTRPVDKRLKPEALPAAKQAESDPDYAEAVKVEGHRQEAINQMNRLASFYSVSAETLSTLEPPTFETMPNVGVPKPAPTTGERFSGDTGGTGGASGRSDVASPRHPAQDVDAPTAVQPEAPKDVHGTISVPDRPVGTEIDSVGTLPPPTTSTPGPQAPVTTTGPTATGTPVPLPPGLTGPLGQGAGKFGANGNKNPFTAQGRASTSNPSGTSRGPQGRGATNNPMGRAGSTEQSTSRGGMQGGRPTSTARGVTGGTPRPNSTAPGRASGPGTTGAARSNGVVGGRPTQPKAGGQTGSRVPRGTVMGEGAAGNSRGTAGRIGQRGVMGAPSTETTGRSSGTGRRIPGSSEAVTGRPAGKGPAARAGRNGFTSGGEGLVRGPNTRRGRDEDDQEGSERPDYLVEDEATHLPQKQRRDVPPVID
ncbi:hypothetical protein ACIBL6_46270 [Streptomyces sp. NPDC050400]|uniref:hypothetical protein n=1 Tax=Streptomyces sp. NPDC050400 TaxID=3365610 RepID=UPI003798D93F